MRVFGSQATGLYLPTSDIDLVMYLPDEENPDDDDKNKDKTKVPSSSAAKKKKKKLTEEQEMESWDESTFLQQQKSPLNRLACALLEQWKDEICYLEVIGNTRIPIVKFTHAPTNLDVDICCNQTGGPESAELIKRFMQAMPPLRPLTIVLKYFMKSRGWIVHVTNDDCFVFAT